MHFLLAFTHAFNSIQNFVCIAVSRLDSIPWAACLMRQCFLAFRRLSDSFRGLVSRFKASQGFLVRPKLMQAAGFDLELLMEGDDFFAYDTVIEGVGFDSEPLMQGTSFEFEPRLEVDGVGQDLITTDVGFVWEPLTENVGCDRELRQGGVGLDFEHP